MENKEKVVLSSEKYQNDVHRLGRIGMCIIVLYMAAMPFILGAVYDCLPSMKSLALTILAIVAMYTPSALGEVFSYTPILGSSSYLVFTTGNTSNLKFPVIMNAMKIAGVDQNTEEADAISLLATAVSSLLTMAIIAVGALLVRPLQPVFELPAVKTAADYMLPALFGAMIYGFLFNETGKTTVKGKGLIPLLPVLLVGGLILAGILPAAMATAMIIVVLPLNIWLSRVLFKKGILQVAQIEQKKSE